MSNELERDSRAQAIMMAMNLESLGAMVLVYDAFFVARNFRGG